MAKLTVTRLELVKPKHNTETSFCCKGKIFMSLADGVLVGSCSRCEKNLLRINPRTNKQEWLHGESPWTQEDAKEGI